MSGGYAYVYKLQDFNVNAEALRDDELRLLKPTPEQARELRELIVQHETETGSHIARTLLQDFEAEVENFSVVMPTDYASVLQILEDAASNGDDPEGQEVWDRILEATNG
jgi:glutamate synthase (NADPH/NADH) large chain